MKSYLAWPVFLIGVEKELHVTLKYLGSTPVTEVEIRSRLLGLDLRLNLSDVCFRPRKFNPVTHVLEIVGIPQTARDVHAAVASLRKDDFPGWRPHLTVSKEEWESFRLRDVQVESVGSLTWYVDKEPTAVFE